MTPNPEPVLLSAEALHSWIDDGYHADAIDPADELLLAREVIGALVAGSSNAERDAARAERRDYLVLRALGPHMWGDAGGDYEPLGDIRPDLAAYLDGLEALGQEDSL